MDKTGSGRRETGEHLSGCEREPTAQKKERVRRYGEVFTPRWVVEMMCDALPSEAWEPGATFLEPSCGEGVFVCEILRRKFARCRKREDFSDAVRSVYAFEIQKDNVEKTIENVMALCREYFRPTKGDLQTIRDHVIQADALKVMKMMGDPQLSGTVGARERC